MAQKGYAHISYEERCQIYALCKKGCSIRESGQQLERSASTVSRKLKRNCGARGYRYKQTQRESEHRRQSASSGPRQMMPER